MHLIRAATLSVADIDRSIDYYTKWLDYKVAEDTLIDGSLAESWDAAAIVGQRQVVLQPASNRNIFIRLIAQDPHADYRPLMTYGWAAIEICTQDTDSVNERMMESPFEIIGPPSRIEGLDAIYPMQVLGPDGEVVYLTQINSDLPAYFLPRASTPIDSLFILVLASSDMEREMAYLRDKIGLSDGRVMEIDYTMINKAHNIAPGTHHRLATMIHEKDVFLEVDQYPPSAYPRPYRDGELPPGIAMGTFAHPDFDALVARLPGEPSIRPGIIYGGKRALTVKSPDGTLIELVEI